MWGVEILFGIGFVWILFAVISDIKTRDIPNWLNFSLLVFSLAFRFFYSFFSGSGENFLIPLIFGSLTIFLVLNFFSTYFKSKAHEITTFLVYSLTFVLIGYLLMFYAGANQDFSFFYPGVLGVGILFVVGNLFYYGKVFAGGDAKLMVSLGGILPVFLMFNQNLGSFILFLLLFLVIGSLYGILMSIIVGIREGKHFRKGFKILFSREKKMILIYNIFAILFLGGSFLIYQFVYFAVFLFVFPYFYLFIKSVDLFCMIKKISVSKLTVGDWLYRDVKIGKKLIRANWEGVSEEDIKILRKKKNVLVKYGIQFSPVFLISFIVFGILYKTELIFYFLKLIGF